MNGHQNVILECAMNKHWQKSPLPCDFKTETSQQGTTVVLSREEKKSAHTLSLHGAKIPCQKSPLQKTQGTSGFSHVFEHTTPPPGKSSWQSHLNKDQRKTEVGHETESRHSQNLDFPWINWGLFKKKGKESFSKSLKKTISKVAWLIISLTTLTPYDSVHFWDEKKQIYFLI